METNEKGIALIQSFEGIKMKAYKCPSGVWTIGYGHTKNVRKGSTVDYQTAKQYLKEDLKNFEKAVSRYVTVAINENQFSALVSFAFNCGAGNLLDSTLLKRVNKNPNDPEIRAEFLKWNHGGGKVLAGLTRRRAAEADLYFSMS